MHDIASTTKQDAFYLTSRSTVLARPAVILRRVAVERHRPAARDARHLLHVLMVAQPKAIALIWLATGMMVAYSRACSQSAAASP
jgi:hypothetical protein